MQSIPAFPLIHTNLYNPYSHKLKQNTTCLLENPTTVRPVIAQPMISIKYDTGINADTKDINPQLFLVLLRDFIQNIKYTLEYFS